MPIRPENRARYPKDWDKISLDVRRRAQFRCELCDVPNGAWGYREGGRFVDVNKRQMIEMCKRGRDRLRPPFNFGENRIIEIILTVAHLDHTPENCDPANLKAMCQKCHLEYDAEHHRQTAYRTRRDGRAIEMFDE